MKQAIIQNSIDKKEESSISKGGSLYATGGR